MTSADEVVVVVRTLVSISEAFQRTAHELRARPDVSEVSQPCWMSRERRLDDSRVAVGEGEGFSIEWYADAEFRDGRALSFGLQLSWHDGEWAVAGGIRVNDGEGQRSMFDLPTRHPSDVAELVADVSHHVRQLTDSRDSAVRQFLSSR